MHVLLYNQLHPETIPNFPKMQRLLEAGDFRSADVKKIGENLYRARLDHSNRLLFSLYRSQGETYILVLECIANHAYDKSHIPPDLVVRGITTHRKPPDVRIWRLRNQLRVGTVPPSTSTPHWPACWARR